MELQVFISKKGTRVVLATDLHQALQLSDHHYATNIRRWLQDVYQFRDGSIRRPEKLRDYARRPDREGGLLDDYYLSVELAKHISLNSRSKVKQKYANWLLRQEQETEGEGFAITAEMDRLIELTRAMALVSCQRAAEEAHLEVYRERHGGSADFWYHYRAQLLGYRKDDLRRKLEHLQRPFNAQDTVRELLLQLDRYELVRNAVLDYFLAEGKSWEYASNMGKLAKRLAAEMRLDIIDDQRENNLFAPVVDEELLRRIRRPRAGLAA